MSEAKHPLISICIPTYKRPEIIKETLSSIVEANISDNILDVCITDNSTTDETKEMIEREFKNVKFIKYKKTTCEGFLNSIEALKFGDGEFLKLHNDYSKFKTGALNNFIKVIEKYREEKPILFFSMGALNKNIKIQSFFNFNEFLYDIHYYSTWSSAFGIWKKDFDKLCTSDIFIDHMFPHTSFLFSCTDNKSYIVDDTKYVNNLPLKKKGGYNLTDNFVRLYLTMVKHLKEAGYISNMTYSKIENGIIKFVASWYNNVKFNNEIYFFTFENTEQIINAICGKKAVIKYHFWKKVYFIKFTFKQIMKK
jgi:abequosyltransferase